MTRKFATVLVAAAIVLGGGVGWTVAATSHRTAPQARSSGTSPARRLTEVLMTPTVQLRGKPAAPTKVHGLPVGPRWFLASVQHQAGNSSTTALILIDPNGVSHIAATVPGQMSLIAWSRDGVWAMIQGAPGVEVVSLNNGGIIRTSVKGGNSPIQAIGFSLAYGRWDMLTVDYSSPRWKLQRRTLSGTNPITLAVGLGDGDIVTSGDGGTLFVPEHGEIQFVDSLGRGGPQPVPSSAGCVPVRMWTWTSLLAHCGGYDGQGGLKALPLYGGQTRWIARDPVSKVAGVPVVAVNRAAFPALGGTYANASDSCTQEWISRADANGVTTPITNTHAAIAYNLIASDGLELATRVTEGACYSAPRPKLMWMNPLTGATRTIFTATAPENATFLAFPTWSGVE